MVSNFLGWGVGFGSRCLATLLNMPDALRSVPHHDKQSGPFRIGKLSQRLHNACVDLASVWLSQLYNKHTMMRPQPVVRKSLISGNQQTLFSLCHLPQRFIPYSFIYRTSNVVDVVSQAAKRCDSHEGNVFVDKDFHVLSTSASRGVTCSSAREAT